MKKIILITAMLILSATSFCQQTSLSPTLNRAEYFTKSKTQKIIGFVLLGAGITTLAVASTGNIDFNTLGALVVAGGAATLGSIPLFIASARNKKKAMAISTVLHFEKIQSIAKLATRLQLFPVISVKINL